MTIGELLGIIVVSVYVVGSLWIVYWCTKKINEISDKIDE